MSDEKAPANFARVRSPNYPAFGLKTAIQQTQKLFKKIHTHVAPREVILEGLGYTTYNGASASALSAQLKYGLIIKVGEAYKLSDRSMSIIHPRDQNEKAKAIQSAGLGPPLFSEMASQFGGHIPDDSLLRANLIRKGFGASAVGPFIQAFRETMELVEAESAQYASQPDVEPEDEMLQEPTGEATPVAPQGVTPPLPPTMEAGERELLHGPLSRTVSYRLVMRGEAGPKDLGKLIKILQLQKSFLEDEDEGESGEEV